MRSRSVDYPETTRQALVDSAVELFTRRGYAGTSLDTIVKRARVTKGALYHHFTGKQALFEAAFELVEAAAMDRLTVVLSGEGTPWERAMAGVQAYVRACLEPAYQRIVIHEGPVVMGWERWREAEEQLSYGLVRSTVEALVDAGEIEPLPVEVTARILFGALSAGGEAIAGSADPKSTAADVTTTIVAIMTGLRRTG